MATVAAQNSKSDYMYYVHSLIGFFFLFLFGHIPAVEPVTPVGMQIAGVFIGLVYLWSTVGTLWTSLLGVIAFGMTDYIDVAGAIKEGMGDSTVWMLISVMVLAGAINQSGSGEHIARWMLTRKFVVGRPVVFTITFLTSLLLSGVFLTSVANCFLGWTLVQSISNQLGYKKGDRYPTMLILGVMIVSIAGTSILPFKGIRIALSKAFAKSAGISIDFALYMVITAFLGVAIIVLYALAMKYIFKADFSRLENINLEMLETKELQPMTFRAKSYLYAFLFVVLLIVALLVFPAKWPVITFLNELSLGGIFALVVSFLCFIRKDGKPLLNFKEASREIQWNIIFICAAAIPVASALTEKETGISQLFKGLIGPVFEGSGTFVFVASVIIISMVLTNIGSNVGMGLLLIPIIVPFIKPLGVDGSIIGIFMVYLVNIAFILPGASPIAALLHGNEWITAKDIYKYGSFIFIGYIALCALIVYPLYCLFF